MPWIYTFIRNRIEISEYGPALRPSHPGSRDCAEESVSIMSRSSSGQGGISRLWRHVVRNRCPTLNSNWSWQPLKSLSRRASRRSVNAISLRETVWLWLLLALERRSDQVFLAIGTPLRNCPLYGFIKWYFNFYCRFIFALASSTGNEEERYFYYFIFIIIGYRR